MKTIQNIKATFSTLFIGILCVLGVTIGAIVITNPFMLVVPVVWLMEIPRDISHEPKYSEIYNQTFELQQDLFLSQWEDSKIFVLRRDGWSSWCPVIAKVEKGTRLRVKKIVLRERWAGKDLRILIQIDDPRFSRYKVNSRRAISATDLTTSHRLAYSDVVEKAQFDPELLKKVTPGQDNGSSP